MNMKKTNPLTTIFSLCALAALSSLVHAQTVNFAPKDGKNGKASTSSCVVLDDKGTLATVVELGSDVKKATLVAGERKVPLKYIVNDADSRVAIYQIPADALDVAKNTVTLGSSLGLKAAQDVYTSPVEKGGKASVVSRINRFQGRVLPLAVLRLNHGKPAPKPGSGIYNADGKLVGLVRQTVYNAPNSSYCLPSEVITRIRNDYQRNGKVSRCWIGIIMDELVAAPIIESIRPDSPAKKAGLEKGDVILSIGAQTVTKYAEVVDAFYYLVAGESKKFRVLRGTEVKEFDVVPEASPGL